MLFETEKKAETFIKFNNDNDEFEKGYSPCRSYYCISCCGYHVTSKPQNENIKSKTELLLERYEVVKEKDRLNKEKIERLTKAGLMTKAGFEIIEIAKQNGSWNILDESEALIVPEDLKKGFQKSTAAMDYFSSLSRSDKRNILQWLVLAKRQETREKRITEIIELAEQKLKPKQFRGNKNSN